MWVSKKKFKALEKRIADLEVQVQGQQIQLSQKLDCKVNINSVKEVMQKAMKSTLAI